MLYKTLKLIVRLAMTLFCRKIVINKPSCLNKKGPLLLACNHPNSFLDAVILLTLFDRPVHSLTRGDVFKKPFFRRLLTSLNMLPVYRTSEGAENLNINYDTFDACKKVFKQNGIVLIFSEGKCINEWHLRPLKKGTARLAFSSWKENTPLEILPVGINYSSFRRFGKNVFINFGEIISQQDFDLNESEGKRYRVFNEKLNDQLQNLVLEIDKKDISKQKRVLQKRPSLLQKVFLFIPACIGWIAHILLYWPVKIFTLSRTRNNDHYDSVLTALLLFIYPAYILIITLLLYYFTQSAYVFFLLLILPFTIWSYVQLKPQLDRSSI